tara:strand:- start:173 stop:1027 length:855 start_codon:yes stop_codon:yes gene_type:complete
MVLMIPFSNARDIMTIDEALTAIKSQETPKVLLRAAAELAKSDIPQAHQTLLQALNSNEFLNRLNTQEEHGGNPNSLRMRRILDTLIANPNPLAMHTILMLTHNDVFLNEGSRVVLLIRASTEIRPVPPELVVFWDKYTQPDDGFTHMVIEALIYNATLPALNLFEAKVISPAYEFDDKTYWFRDNIMPLRNKLEIVQSAGRLLLDPQVEQDLRIELVDVLYDYKSEWFTPAVNFKPPELESYTQAVKKALVELADYALKNISLDEERKKMLEKSIASFKQGEN